MFDKQKSRKGIYILPNALTTINMFCGFCAIIYSLNGRFVEAAYAIVIAIVFDILDGKVARITNTTSQFGIEYDSLADLISFGVAPSIVTYLWALSSFGRIGWMAAFLYTVCGALRLARFNSQTKKAPSSYFTGLPIPAAAGTLASIILFFDKINLMSNNYKTIILISLYFLAFLMVSTVKYSSFKKTSLSTKKIRFDLLVLFVLFFILIAVQPAISLFFIAMLYISSGFLRSLIKKMEKNEQKEI